ncbi:tetratricopeptide repeat protein, partial [Planctomycetota bacterium]
RGAWLAAFVAFCLAIGFILLHRQLRRDVVERVWGTRRARVALLSVLTVAILIPMIPIISDALPGAENRKGIHTRAAGALKGKITEALSRPKAWSGDLRFATYRNTIELIKENPLGVGPGNWRVVFPLYKGKVAETHWFDVGQEPWETHDDPLQILSETGVLGGMAFLSIFLILAWFVHLHVRWKEGTGEQRVIMFTLLVAIWEVLTHSVFSFPFHRPASAMQAWIWIGVLTGVSLHVPGVFKRRVRLVREHVLAITVAFACVAAVAGWRHFWHIQADVGLKTADHLMRQPGGLPVAINVLLEARKKCGHFLVDRYLARAGLAAYHEKRLKTPTAKQAYEWNQQVLDKDPHYIRAVLAQGELAMDLRKLQIAKDAYKKITALAPKHPHGFQGLGLLALMEGNTKEAELQFEQALKRYDGKPGLEKLEAETYDRMGRVHYMQGRVDRAIATFTRVLELQPNSAAPLLNLASILRRLGRLGEAIKYLEKAAEVQPNLETARVNLGDAYFNGGRLTAAVKQFQEALRINAQSETAHMNLGAAYLRLNKPENAVHHLREAVRINPRSAKARNNLGSALTRMGKIEEARQRFREALNLDPRNQEARNNLERLKSVGAGGR